MAIPFGTEQLSIYYGHFQAVKQISLTFPEASVTALIGPSGCGKSTFLRSLNRMNDEIAGSRTEGHIWMDGNDLNEPGTDVIKLRQKSAWCGRSQTLFISLSTTISHLAPIPRYEE